MEDIYVNSASSFYGFLTKINSSLNTSLWNKIFNGSSNEYIQFLSKISSNQYLAIGHTRYNGYGILIMKLDSDGNILSSKKIGSSNNDYGMAIKQINDFYYFTGKFYNSSLDIIFSKINSDLNINSCSILNSNFPLFTNYSFSNGSGPSSYVVSSLSINNFFIQKLQILIY